MHFNQHITAADELAIKVHLRNSWPIAKRFNILPQLLIVENVGFVVILPGEVVILPGEVVIRPGEVVILPGEVVILPGEVVILQATNKTFDPPCISQDAFWNVIVVTSQSEKSVDQVCQALIIEKQANRLSIGEILTVVDPAPCIGSGGATLNALYCVAEHLSAASGLCTLSPDEALANRRILLLHVGSGSRPYLFDPLGRHVVMVPTGDGVDEVTKSENVSLVSERWASLAVHCVRQMTWFCSASAATPDKDNIDASAEADASPAGVWVCGTDFYMRLSRPVSWGQLVSDSCPEVLTVAGLCSADEAMQHGVLALDSATGFVTQVVYRPSAESLVGLEIGCVPDDSSSKLSPRFARVSGPYYFPPSVAAAMVGLHTTAPLHGCIYDGIDSGAPPIYLSLVFDLLAAFCCPDSKDQASDEPNELLASASTTELAMRQSRGLGDLATLAALNAAESAARIDEANRQLKDRLGGFKNRLVLLSGAEFCYLANEPEAYFRLLLDFQSQTLSTWRFHCSYNVDCSVESAAMVAVSGLSEASAATERQQVLLKKLIQLPVDCYLSCVRVRLRDDEDGASGGSGHPDTAWRRSAHFANPWRPRAAGAAVSRREIRWCRSMAQELVERTSFWKTVEQVPLEILAWLFNCPDGDGASQPDLAALWRRCRRLSMADIVANVDIDSELTHRRSVAQSALVRALSATLRHSSGTRSSGGVSGLRSLFGLAVAHGFDSPLLPALDSLALRLAAEGGGDGIARARSARVLAAIGLLLGTQAGSRGGLRSGPADNRRWSGALSDISAGQLSAGLSGMANLRAEWAGRPDLLMRAARHYERAAQLLVSGAVRASCLDDQLDAARSVSRPIRPAVPIGHGVTALCPARIDLSGGWSDTPPICWEFGGCVANIAVLVDGRKPIGCRVEAFDHRPGPGRSLIELVNADANSSGAVVGLNSLEYLADCSRPLVPGALAKCCLIVSGLFSVDSSAACGSLAEQVSRVCGSEQRGIRVTAWSVLPAGSGLGTSSILAAAVLAALHRWAGLGTDLDRLVRGVLAVEQLLSTGGGWQDQVGGLYPGIKVARSPKGLPLRVQVTPLEPPAGFLDRLDSSFILLYSGSTRLARNLLQEAVRSWHCRDASVVSIIAGLVDDAECVAKAVELGDLSLICQCIRRYRGRKLAMAPGSESAQLTSLLDRLENFGATDSDGSTADVGVSSAAILCGAGGGGFLAALLPPAARNRLLAEAASDGILPGSGGARLHTVRVARDGLEFV
uniref:Fucokinase domain-containing protein n=1 Tax=Macrostomum lignano TaxID=282301 RepID=A0A1I8I8X3_9PLAT